MQDMEHLLNRIGFGLRPGQMERVQAIGLENYLDQQLHPERIDDSSTDRLLAAQSSIHMRSSEVIEKYPRPRQLLQELQEQKIIRAVHSERQLQEVMTDFWYNHFNVF